MTKAEFGRKLRALRESKNLSQEELANLIGLKDRSSISKIEKGLRGIDYDNLERLVVALGVNPLDFFTKEESFSLTAHEKELITAYRTSSEDTQKAVCSVLGIVKKNGTEACSEMA